MTTDIYENKVQLSEVFGHTALFSDETGSRKMERVCSPEGVVMI